MNQSKNPDNALVIDTGGRRLRRGNVNTGGGKFVGRDDVSMTLAQGASREEFAQLLAEFGRMLAEAGLPEKTVRIIEGDVKHVQDEAAASKPDRKLIENRLTGITTMLGKVGNAAEVAGGTMEKLVTLGKKLYALAAALF
jgi:hypothetical protein